MITGTNNHKAKDKSNNKKLQFHKMYKTIKCNKWQQKTIPSTHIQSTIHNPIKKVKIIKPMILLHN